MGLLRLVVDILVEYFDSIAGLVENCLEPIGFTSGIFMPILLSHFDQVKMSGRPGIILLPCRLDSIQEVHSDQIANCEVRFRHSFEG